MSWPAGSVTVHCPVCTQRIEVPVEVHTVGKDRNSDGDNIVVNLVNPARAARHICIPTASPPS